MCSYYQKKLELSLTAVEENQTAWKRERIDSVEDLQVPRPDSLNQDSCTQLHLSNDYKPASASTYLKSTAG